MPENISAQLRNVQHSLKQACTEASRDANSVQLIAVSKRHSVESIQAAYNAGQLDFGENYVQELVAKFDELHARMPQARWHYIGALQRNKVKYIAEFVHLIHGVDSLRLAKEISKRALQHSRVIDILLQVNTSGEESKSGCAPSDTADLLHSISELPGVRVCGLMTMAERSGDLEHARTSFAELRNLRDTLIQTSGNTDIHHLSMGMSGDYAVAIEEGATLVRIGTAIFGQRPTTIQT